MTAFAACICLLTACGMHNDDLNPANDLTYVRVAKSVLPHLKGIAEFELDHRHSANFVFGWLPASSFSKLSSQAKSGINKLSKKFETATFDSETLNLDVKPGVEKPNPKRDEDDYDVIVEPLRDGYHDYEQLTDMLQGFTSVHPNISDLYTAGLTEQGRNLWYVKLSDNPKVDEDEPKLLYIANMHGNEVVGREVILKFIERLVTEYDTNPRIKNLIDHSQIYIMPSLNPDGFELGTRRNAKGIDLNRSFPDFTQGDADNQDGKPAETKAIMQLHDEHHFLIALNFHGGALCMNIPWDSKPNVIPEERFEDDPLMMSLAKQYADTNPVMHKSESFAGGVIHGYEWWHIPGGMQDWASYYRRSVHATVELTVEYWPSYDTIEGFWQENTDALLGYLERGINGLHIKVTDESGNPINNVYVRISSSPARLVRYETHLIHRPTQPGNQTAEISAEGYEDKIINFTPHDFNDVYETITLNKTK